MIRRPVFQKPFASCDSSTGFLKNQVSICNVADFSVFVPEGLSVYWDRLSGRIRGRDESQIKARADFEGFFTLIKELAEPFHWGVYELRARSIRIEPQPTRLSALAKEKPSYMTPVQELVTRSPL